MTGNKIFDCQEMFRHACAFCECADMALDKFKNDTADIDFYVSPVTINSAFACEVFLKAILTYQDKKTPRLHKLRDLYNALPKELKKLIKCEVSGGYPDMWTNFSGQDYLDNISDAFVEWRYNYEHDWRKDGCTMHIEIGFLNRFRDTLREICCRMFFGVIWDEYKGGDNEKIK